MKPFPYNTPVNCRYGAPMGRPNYGHGASDYTGLVRLRPVPLDQGYDKGGAYWGCNSCGNRLFCAFSPDRQITIFARAANSQAAAIDIAEHFPQAKIAA